MHFTSHQDLHHTPPHYRYMHFTSHPALVPFPSQLLADIHPTSNSLHFNSLHFTSLHFTYHFTIPVFGNTRFPLTSKSLHFTSLHFTLSYPSPRIYLVFLALQNPCTSLRLSHLIPCCFCNSVKCFRCHFNNIGLRVTLFVTSYILC